MNIASPHCYHCLFLIDFSHPLTEARYDRSRSLTLLTSQQSILLLTFVSVTYLPPNYSFLAFILICCIFALYSGVNPLDNSGSAPPSGLGPPQLNPSATLAQRTVTNVTLLLIKRKVCSPEVSSITPERIVIY